MSEMKRSIILILIVLIIWGCAPKKEIEPVKTITSSTLPKEEKEERTKEQIIKKAQLYIEKGEYEKAVLELNKAIELDPQDASLYYTLGDLYEQLGQDKESVAAFVKALQLSKEEEKISQKGTEEIKSKEVRDKKIRK